MPRLRRHRPTAGFTQVELLVTLCVACVLAGVAVPAGFMLGGPAKLSDFAHGFLSHLQLARSEAILRRRVVVMCKSAEGRSCTHQGAWEQGWILFEDRNGNALRDPDEPLLQVGEALPDAYRVRGNLNVANYIAFTPAGGTRTASGAFQAGTVNVCRVSSSATEARQIVINAVGRPRMQKAMVDSCG